MRAVTGLFVRWALLALAVASPAAAQAVPLPTRVDIAVVAVRAVIPTSPKGPLWIVADDDTAFSAALAHRLQTQVKRYIDVLDCSGGKCRMAHGATAVFVDVVRQEADTAWVRIRTHRPSGFERVPIYEDGTRVRLLRLNSGWVSVEIRRIWQS